MSPLETELACLFEQDVQDDKIAACLMALSGLPPAADDLAALARMVVECGGHVAAPDDAIDVCGTGGDHANTLNVSTAGAFVAAACGAKIAKHGNRAASSRSGAMDVLGALGVPTDLPPEDAARQIERIGLTFLNAAQYYPVLARLVPFRKALGRPTLFNLIGPLINPARVKRQLIGVYSAALAPVMAEAARQLGLRTAWVVCGGGMDELSLTAVNEVAILQDGGVSSRLLDMRSGGIPEGTLTGGTAEHNAAAMVAMLNGAPGIYRETVALNTAAALVVAGMANSIEDGRESARKALDSGAALAKLKQIREWRP